MPLHEIKICPCCQKEFECKAGSFLLCQCAGISLSAGAREMIDDKYDDCLCIACLTHFEKAACNKALE